MVGGRRDEEAKAQLEGVSVDLWCWVVFKYGPYCNGQPIGDFAFSQPILYTVRSTVR